MVRNILINFPTNIGDVIVALPTLDLIKANYPQAKITAMVSLKTEDLIRRNTFINDVVAYDKRWRIKDKINFCRKMRGKYDLMVDFKHTLLPLILRIPLRTPLLRFFPGSLHTRDKNMKLVAKLTKGKEVHRGEFRMSEEEKRKWLSYGFSRAIFVAAFSNSHIKMYPKEKLKVILGQLSKDYKIVILGEENNVSYYGDILFLDNVVNLLGKTTLYDVFYLLKEYALLCLSIDTGILHLASYLNLSIVALFGPTDEAVTGPWSDNHKVLISPGVKCRPCMKAKCSSNMECMKEISTQEVIKAVTQLIGKVESSK